MVSGELSREVGRVVSRERSDMARGRGVARRELGRELSREANRELSREVSREVRAEREKKRSSTRSQMWSDEGEGKGARGCVTAAAGRADHSSRPPLGKLTALGFFCLFFSARSSDTPKQQACGGLGGGAAGVRRMERGRMGRTQNHPEHHNAPPHTFTTRRSAQGCAASPVWARIAPFQRG